MSGLKVSFNRSEIFYCNVSKDYRKTLEGLMVIKKDTSPIRYLGVPLISGKLKESDCKPLIDKTIARVFSWTTRYLSYAGELQLISSVLSIMYNYWCNVFLLPKKKR